MARDVVVLSGARTPMGGYGGSLKDIPATELAAQCVRESVDRAGIDGRRRRPRRLRQRHPHGPARHYLARVAGIKGGCRTRRPR